MARHSVGHRLALGVTLLGPLSLVVFLLFSVAIVER
jgi:hypothetical protein